MSTTGDLEADWEVLCGALEAAVEPDFGGSGVLGGKALASGAALITRSRLNGVDWTALDSDWSCLAEVDCE